MGARPRDKAGNRRHRHGAGNIAEGAKVGHSVWAHWQRQSSGPRGTPKWGARTTGMRQTMLQLCSHLCRGGETGAQHLGAFSEVRARGPKLPPRSVQMGARPRGTSQTIQAFCRQLCGGDKSGHSVWVHSLRFRQEVRAHAGCPDGRQAQVHEAENAGTVQATVQRGQEWGTESGGNCQGMQRRSRVVPTSATQMGAMPRGTRQTMRALCRQPPEGARVGRSLWANLLRFGEREQSSAHLRRPDRLRS
mmetsp:Transcript_10172/g.17749  ORF Transcript_10172/g.17749 Transcript_10172/m.17749 type:complete len:248 (+) Transcript_10172:835-1578(+)